VSDGRKSLITAWDKNQTVHVQGLEGGGVPYALQRLPLICPDTQTLIICPTSKSAVRLADDLRAIAPCYQGDVPIHFFPAPDHLPYHPLTPSRDTWVARLQHLYEWTRRAPMVSVAPVTALLRCLPPPDIFYNYGTTISVGQTIDLITFAQQLTAMGYASAPLVEESGDFSRRGGLMDIWSLAEDLPCRIELDGDMIVSIRNFDPESQRSQGDLSTITIIPAHNLYFDDENLPAITKRLKHAADAVDYPANKRRAIVEALQNGRRLPVMESLLPCFYDKAATIADYLSEKTRVIIVDPAAVRTEADAHLTQCTAAYQETEDCDRIVPPDQLLTAWPKLREQLPSAVCTIGGLIPKGVEVTWSADTHTTTAYKNNTLTPLLEHAHAKGLNLLITTPTPLQAERILDMLRWQGKAPSQESGLLFANPPQANGIQVAVSPLSSGFEWASEGILCITEEELFGRKLSRRPKPTRAVENFISFSDLNIGDLLVHMEHGIGRYVGLTHMAIQDHATDFLILEYLGGDKLYLPVYRMNLVQRYVGGDEGNPTLDKMGGTRFTNAKKRAHDAIQIMAKDLLRIYAERTLHKGFAFNPRDEALETFEAAFPFEETPDQWDAIEAVLADMQQEKPMDRLVCGDVGFGKTEIAMRAAYRAVLDGKQVAVLVPTTLLAFQHHQSFLQRFKNTGVRIEYLSRFVSRADQKKILADTAAGTVDILIGTHRLLQKDILFKRLGLLVIDEEHRFGVGQKEKIRELKSTVDTMAMSATPIPRTLHMTLSGLRDISVIRTPPADRQTIRTYIAEFEDRLIREVILKELARGGQFFFVHNRVETIFHMADQLRKIVPEARIKVGHGQMSEHELEDAMIAFTKKDCDGLLCTTIIESGIDIPSANTIIINRADTFGLSQLYQIRGRVGRSNLQAYAYMLTPQGRELTEIAEKRLSTLQRYTDLGSGFSIAMHDLEIRGGGNMLGAQQSGHIHDIGYELFTQLLEQAIRELKGEKHTTEVDPEITLPVSAFLPEDYVNDAQLRLVCYKHLSGAETLEALDGMAGGWADRFGPLPDPAQNLFKMMEVKLLAKAAKAEQVQYDGDYLSLRLHEDTPIPREKLMHLMQAQPDVYQIRPPSTLKIAMPGLKGNALFSAIRKAFTTLTPAR